MRRMAETADLALILAFDCSASVSWEEFNLIAGGTAAALRDPKVAHGLIGGPNRLSLAAVLQFSSHDAQVVVQDWTRLATPADVAGFADAVDNQPRLPPAKLTAIGNALAACGVLLQDLPVPARRRVVDIAADGRANDGIAPAPLRDALVATGTTINGLAVLHEEPDLAASFAAEIIGGPGAFVQLCASYADFAEAMRRKLLRELTEVPVA